MSKMKELKERAIQQYQNACRRACRNPDQEYTNQKEYDPDRFLPSSVYAPLCLFNTIYFQNLSPPLSSTGYANLFAFDM